MRELADLATIAVTRSRHTTDDGFLRALLSFAPLTIRGQIIEFLATLTRRLSRDQRLLLRDLLLTAFSSALDPNRDTAHDSYQPARLNAPARHAAYSANLLLLIALIGGPVAGHELFPHSPLPAAEWRRHALLWRSQFVAEAWRNLAHVLTLDRTWHDNERDVSISLTEDEPRAAPELDAFWIFHFPPDDARRQWLGWRQVDTQHLIRESHFTCDLAGDIAWHALAPITREMDDADRRDLNDVEATTAFATLSADQALSVTNAITRLWIASSRPTGGVDLQQAYEDCLSVIQRSRPDEDTVSRDAYLARVLRQIAADRERLTPDFRARTLNLFKETILNESQLSDLPLVRHWASQAFADIGWRPAAE
ncbi:hypothetical protein GCM10023193_33960 [Planotetraspora kaengkrachanensis]|uniref:hypothetical protein n=1 Tax=Planotetraspora kaengkrachanensis TaxID=575193 RepID=UPI0031F03DC9